MSQAELKEYMQELLKKYETAEKYVAKLSQELVVLKRAYAQLEEQNRRLRIRPKQVRYQESSGESSSEDSSESST